MASETDRGDVPVVAAPAFASLSVASLSGLAFLSGDPDEEGGASPVV